MLVTDREEFPDNERYCIEFGISSWSQNLPKDEQDESVRNRYDLEDGKFSPHNSSEIPLADIPLILRECLKRDKFNEAEMLEMLDQLSDSIRRQAT